MDKLSKMALYFIVCALVLVSLHPAVPACQVDEFYLTTEGPLAASTPENLREASTYQEKGDREKLAVMMKNGMVIKLKEDIKVQVLERSFEHRMLKFRFLDQGASYWVKDGSLRQIICN